jgi:RNA recognition motif-containing protein
MPQMGFFQQPLREMSMGVGLSRRTPGEREIQDFGHSIPNKKEMSMNIYVGNLSFDVNEEELRNAFEEFGKVESANVIKDKYSGQSRGFGFIEMSDKAEAQSAVNGMNGKELKGRTLSVNEARPRSDGRTSAGRGGGGHQGQGGYGGGGGAGRRF